MRLTRIFHGISTAGAQEGMSTALRLFGLLDILNNMPSSPSLRAPCIHTLLYALATKPHEISGLKSAGEWHEFQKMLPDFDGKRVLDLGCGFGWHCIYAAEQSAASVVGVDISEKMLAVAREKTNFSNVCYVCAAIEEYEYPENSFDVIVSSLAFHYIEPYDDICTKVSRCLTENGGFIFSVEHPVFTAQGKQDWAYDDAGNK